MGNLPDDVVSGVDRAEVRVHQTPLVITERMGPPPPGPDLDALVAAYEGERPEEALLSGQVEELLVTVDKRTYGRYAAGDEAATLLRLQEDLEALDQREAAVDEMWKSMLAGLKGAFLNLNRDFDTLRSRIDELNRRLGGCSVSDLEQLRLVVQDKAELRRIRPCWHTSPARILASL